MTLTYDWMGEEAENIMLFCMALFLFLYLLFTSFSITKRSSYTSLSSVMTLLSKSCGPFTLPLLYAFMLWEPLLKSKMLIRGKSPMVTGVYCGGKVTLVSLEASTVLDSKVWFRACITSPLAL